jgi:hypothetical protein
MIKGAPDGSEQAAITELAERLQLAQNTVTDLVARAEAIAGPTFPGLHRVVVLNPGRW